MRSSKGGVELELELQDKDAGEGIKVYPLGMLQTKHRTVSAGTVRSTGERHKTLINIRILDGSGLVDMQDGCRRRRIWPASGDTSKSGKTKASSNAGVAVTCIKRSRTASSV